MDSGALAGWATAAVALIGFWVAERHRTKDVGAKSMNERLKPLEDAITRHDMSLDRHAGTAAAMALDLATLQRQMADHEKQDEDRFSRIEEMHREIREDIKTLLVRGTR